MINEDSRKNASHRYNVQVNCYVFFISYMKGEDAEIFMIKLFQ